MGASTICSVEVGGAPKTAEGRPHRHEDSIGEPYISTRI